MSETAVERFNELVGSMRYPMFIVTTSATDDGERSGCLVGFATQASIEPARFLVCLSVANHTLGVAKRASHLGVHLVGSDQRELAAWFGELTGDEVDKFADVPTADGAGGVPVLTECAGWFVGRVIDRFEFGDHVGHLLEPVAVSVAATQGSSGPDHELTSTDTEGFTPGHPA